MRYVLSLALFALMAAYTLAILSVAPSADAQCATVNCQTRQESGQGGTIVFNQGDTVIGWNVRPLDRFDFPQHPCIWWNVPVWGKLTDGVRNPYWPELQDAVNRGWRQCGDP